MGDFLYSSESVIVDLSISSQKQLFQEMAKAIIDANGLDVTVRDIVSAAVERERLGSTGVGNGCLLYTSPSPRD